MFFARILLLITVAWLVLQTDIRAQGIIWTGPTITFSNAPGSSWFLAANQDRISDNVWLTRDTKKGLFNARNEASYNNNLTPFSPVDTEWAIGALTNWATLSYSTWEACYGGQNQLASQILNRPTVLHLIPDDIYLSITFTYWGGFGGGFAYTRSTAAVPEPSAAALFIGGALLWLQRHRRR